MLHKSIINQLSVQFDISIRIFLHAVLRGYSKVCEVIGHIQERKLIIWLGLCVPVVPKLVIPERVHGWAVLAALRTIITPSVDMLSLYMSVDVLLGARFLVTDQALKLSNLIPYITISDLIIFWTKGKI